MGVGYLKLCKVAFGLRLASPFMRAATLLLGGILAEDTRFRQLVLRNEAILGWRMGKPLASFRLGLLARALGLLEL